MDNLQEIIEEECKKHVKDVRSQIRNMLKKATMSLLGLEDCGRDIQIDHCNGRNSVLIDAFRECALEEAKKIAKNYKPTSESVVHFATTFQNEFDSQLRNEIRNQAKIKAKEEAEKIISAIKVDVQNVLAKADGGIEQVVF